MTGSVVLDVAIGMSFVFLACSVLCSALVEAIAGLCRLRARDLEKGIRNLISGPDEETPAALRKIESDVLGHSLMTHLSPDGSRKPSYIPSRTFALALLDALVPESAGAPGSPPGETAGPVPSDPSLRDKNGVPGSGGLPAPGGGSTAPPSFQQIELAIGRLPDSDLKKSLGLLVRHAGNNVDTLRDHVETWFNNAMERLSGAYKRRAQILSVMVGLLLCGALNIDAIGLVNTISADPGLRSALSSAAVDRAKPPANGATPDPESLRNLAAQFNILREDPSFSRLPLGWPCQPGPGDDASTGSGRRGSPRPQWLTLAFKVMGLAFSTFAVSLGAPFWFDVLGKVANLRMAGGKPPAPGRSGPDGQGNVLRPSGGGTAARA